MNEAFLDCLNCERDIFIKPMLSGVKMAFIPQEEGPYRMRVKGMRKESHMVTYYTTCSYFVFLTNASFNRMVQTILN